MRVASGCLLLVQILIPYESIRDLEKTTTMVFQHAIRLVTFDKDEYTFTSFWGNNRDACLDLIVKTRDRVLQELCLSEVGEEKLHDSKRRPPSAARELLSPVSSSPSSATGLRYDQDAAEEGKEEEGEEGEEVEQHGEGVASLNNISTVGVNEIVTAVERGNDGDDNYTICATPRRRSVVLDTGSIAPKDISMTRIFDEVFPVSVDTFVQTFCVDNAPFGLDKFAERIGSTDITVNPWITLAEGEKSFGTCVLCLE